MSDEPLQVPISIWKNGEQVAHADHCGPIILDGSSKWPGIEKLHCYYFSVLHLEPPVVFEHLSGRALTYFFDHCSAKFQDEEVINLRYVHGRSEVMKGKHKVSAVLLIRVQTEGPLDNLLWLSYLPSIYEEFLSKYQATTKTA